MNGCCSAVPCCQDAAQSQGAQGNLEGISVWPPGDDSLGGSKIRSPTGRRPPPLDTLDSEPQTCPTPRRTPRTPRDRSKSPEQKRSKSPRSPREKGCCSFGPRYSEDEMLNQAYWCCYCCCGGCASSCWTLRPLQLACHSLCCSQVCETVACLEGGGLCKVISDCCCCSFLIQLPRRTGRPKCVLCSQNCCGNVGGAESRYEQNSEDWDFDTALDGGCIPCYCGCCGLVVGITACAQHLWKCCCCECRNRVRQCRCCGLVCSAWCFLAQCLLPMYPSPPNPYIAVCGKRCRAPNQEAPQQQHMY